MVQFCHSVNSSGRDFSKLDYTCFRSILCEFTYLIASDYYLLLENKGTVEIYLSFISFTVQSQ